MNTYTLYHYSFVPKENYSDYIRDCIANPAFIDWEVKKSVVKQALVLLVKWRSNY